MKHYTITLFLLISRAFFFCSGPVERQDPATLVAEEITTGNFSAARQLAEQYRKATAGDTLLLCALDSLVDLTRRISLDFSLTEEQIRERVATVMGPFTDDEFRKWEEDGDVEWRLIDGEKRYFNRAATNLKRILEHRRHKAEPEMMGDPDGFTTFKRDFAVATIADSGSYGLPVAPVNMKVTYTLTVDADAVPPGETIRCWMPWPREGHSRQQEVTLLSAFPGEYTIAPREVMQRSVYMEQPAVAGEPARFEVVFTYRSCGQYYDQATLAGTPRADPGAMQEFLGEQAPHILFTPMVKKLSETIVGDAGDPLEIVRRIFTWIDEEIPWAGALEYGTIPNIPEYVISRRHGDCGMKTMLFMTLARDNGIPTKWQSGWMMHPGEVNLHDWCEVWFAGTGWVPLDMSFGRLPGENPRIREFYMTGIDPWRLIVNDDLATPFVPAKNHLRSEPYDFQRGEVEWRLGNLYFDQWDYHMDVQYLP